MNGTQTEYYIQYYCEIYLRSKAPAQSLLLRVGGEKHTVCACVKCNHHRVCRRQRSGYR